MRALLRPAALLFASLAPACAAPAQANLNLAALGFYADPTIANGPSHHSILKIPNVPDAESWYIVYHRHPLNTTGGNQRVMAIDRLHFDADGNIPPIRMTREGPGPYTLPK